MRVKLSETKLRRLIGSMVAMASGVHPLAYLFAYLCMVPIFAIFYCQLSNGFYAPYARLEYSGSADQYEMGKIIQTAIRRSAEARGNTQEDKWVIVPDKIFVQRLHATSEGLITFDLIIMARNKAANNGLIQLPVSASLRFSQSIIMSMANTQPKIYRVFDIEEPIWAEPFIDRNDVLFRQVTENFSKVEFFKDEDVALSEFIAGAMGDALSVSNSFWRMLYFSSVVITTVGFGDIIPMTGLSRLLVAIEALAGIVLIGLFLNAVAYRATQQRET